MAKKGRTVRFDALVKESGEPEQVTLWTKPEADRDFMKAVKSGRVLTLVQRNVGTKKDYGVIGFSREKNAAYLIFPKPLEPKENTRVIGIKYENIAAEKPKGPIYKPKKQAAPGIPMQERPRFALEKNSHKAAAPERKAARNHVPQEPALKRFTGEVQIIATQSVTIQVQAKDKAEAKKMFQDDLDSTEIDLNKAAVKRIIKNVAQER